MSSLAERLVRHYRAHRRDLPWRRTRDPYAIWVSEIMLQQTRVATVIPYYERWMTRFPDVGALARAPLDDVLESWSGLGYYRRARNLHLGARDVVARWNGRLPASARQLREVPGIGRYTAGAIASIAFGLAEPLVDGNVARVLARIDGLDVDVKSTEGQKRLWQRAAELVPRRDPGDFNQALMELGATVCTPTSPACDRCPVAADCVARATGRTGELPVVAARKPARDLPRLDRVAAWVEDTAGTRVLLFRRAPEGLYGGLWELPQAGSSASLAEVLGPGVRLTGRSPCTHEQILSHRRMTIDVVPGVATTPAIVEASAPYDSHSWQPIGAARAMGISTATRSIVDKLT